MTVSPRVIPTSNGRSVARCPLQEIATNACRPPRGNRVSTSSPSCASETRTAPFERYLQASSHRAIEEILNHMRAQYHMKDLILQAIASNVNAEAIVQQLRDGESFASIASKVANGTRI